MRYVAAIVVALIVVVVVPTEAQAYIGPGAGLSAFGALIALVASVVAAVFGFVWYPIKRLIRAFKRDRERSDPAEQDS